MRKSEAEKVMLLLNEIERCERAIRYLEKISVNNIQIRDKDSGLLVELLPKAKEKTKEICISGYRERLKQIEKELEQI
ncbi:MAG: hypothetical protein U0L88_15100 [Acutalibacteraceae bacterium]|nr:hypothetical protein [Acutalibacteraceae bacterium]